MDTSPADIVDLRLTLQAYLATQAKPYALRLQGLACQPHPPAKSLWYGAHVLGNPWERNFQEAILQGQNQM